MVSKEALIATTTRRGEQPLAFLPRVHTSLFAFSKKVHSACMYYIMHVV